MKETIWVVQGASGEYSDHMEWPICFYHDEILAKSHVELASQEHRRISEIIRKSEESGDFDYNYSNPALTNKWDPKQDNNFYWTHDTNYFCFKVELGSLKKPRNVLLAIRGRLK
jgi:hypothetical protein